MIEIGLVWALPWGIVCFFTLPEKADLRGFYLDEPSRGGWGFKIHKASMYCFLLSLFPLIGGFFFLIPLLLWHGLVSTGRAILSVLH